MKSILRKFIFSILLITLFNLNHTHAQKYWDGLKYDDIITIEDSYNTMTEGNYEYIVQNSIMSSDLFIFSKKTQRYVKLIEGYKTLLIGEGKVYYSSFFADNKNYNIYVYDVKTGRTDKLNKVGLGINFHIYLTDVQGNNLFFQREEYEVKDLTTQPIYKLDLSTKKIIRLAKDSSMAEIGKNKVFYTLLDKKSQTTDLYSVDFNGNNNKKLTENVQKIKFINNSLYYVKKVKDDEFALFKADANGNNPKKITNNFIYNVIVEITEKHIIYGVPGVNGEVAPVYFKMDLKTGEVKEVKI